MQSLLQYRRAGAAAQAQLDREAQRNGHFSRQPVDGTLHSQIRNEDEEAYRPISDATTVDTHAGQAEKSFVVDWTGPEDPLMPRAWPLARRIGVTIQISLIGLLLTAASGIDATVLRQAAKDLGVSEVAESLATGLYLAGMGVGCLVAGPLSETFGRNAVYSISLIVFMTFIMASGLAPNFGAQITFRFLAGCCASTPLVCAGGSVADMFDSIEKTWSFPLFAIPSFIGPMIGAVMGAYIGPSAAVSWRWAEWTILIASGLVLAIVLLFMPETYGPLLLQWKAAHYRRLTGDGRYKSEHEIAHATLSSRLQVSITRPFIMLLEPIVMAMTLYITLVSIVLFTFVIGWPYIFEYTYGISSGLSHTIFIAMAAGTELTFCIVPIIYRMTVARTKAGSEKGFSPEIRLWYGTFGAAISIPVSLFWLGWTNYASISIWSAILAVALFGYGVMGIFLCVYMYIIDSYEIYSASALTFVALTRYVVAGGMTVVGIPFFEDMGTHYTLTILACISAALVPVPYLLYYYGHVLRSRSRFAASTSKLN